MRPRERSARLETPRQRPRGRAATLRRVVALLVAGGLGAVLVPAEASAAKTFRHCGTMRVAGTVFDVVATGSIRCPAARRVAGVSQRSEPDGVLQGGPAGWRCFNHHDYPATYCLRKGRQVWWLPAPQGQLGATRTCPDPGGLYNLTGAGSLRVRGVRCTVAWAQVVVWNKVFRGGRTGSLRFGPPGWRCRVRVFSGEGGGATYRCRRGARRLTISTGG